MPKSTSTVLIAFLAGLAVAGGGSYIYTSLRNKGPAPAKAVLPVSQAQPAAAASAGHPAAESSPPAQPQDQDTDVDAQPAPPMRHKPSPSVAQKVEKVKQQEADETAAAPQPTRAEVPQANTPAPAAPAQAVPAQQQQTQTQAPSQTAHTLYPPPGTQTAPPAPREPKTVTIAAGTALTVRVNETISTDKNYAGDTFTASLDRPLVINGFIIVERGSRVIGRVIQAEKAGRVKGLASLSLALTQLHTTDGQTLNIETAPWSKEGENSKKRDAATVVGGAALGAIIGAIAGGGKGAAIGAGTGGAAGTGGVLLTRGKAAVVPSETRLTFSLSSSVPITEHLNE